MTSWQEIEATIAKVPLPRGYRLELLRRSEIPALGAAVKARFLEISGGGASCYLREEFFRGDVYFAGASDKDVLVVLIKKSSEPAGLPSAKSDRSHSRLLSVVVSGAPFAAGVIKIPATGRIASAHRLLHDGAHAFNVSVRDAIPPSR